MKTLVVKDSKQPSSDYRDIYNIAVLLKVYYFFYSFSNSEMTVI